MAIFHLHLSWTGKGAQGGALGFHDYLTRADVATQTHRYLGREEERGEDLVAHGHANLPGWAEDSPATLLAGSGRA